MGAHYHQNTQKRGSDVLLWCLEVVKSLVKPWESQFWGKCRQMMANYYKEAWCYSCMYCISRVGPQRWGETLQSSVSWGPYSSSLLMLLGLCLRESARQYLLVAMDFFRKWPEVYPKRNQEAMIATKLLRAEFFTIFGDQDTKSMEQGRDFDAKVFQQVCQMQVKAIGGIQHPKDGREEKLGWCWEKALSQLHATWPEMPPCTLPAAPVLLLKAWVLASCQHLRRHLRDLCFAQHQNPTSVQLNHPPDTSQESDKRTGTDPALCLFCWVLMTSSVKGKLCLAPVVLFDISQET